MALLSELKPKYGSRQPKRRLGLGEGSGFGQTSTRGQKGQRGRSGQGKQVGFEGGQTPLLRRIPKRGFNNKDFATRYQPVNLGSLEASFDAGTEVTPQALEDSGLIKRKGPIKILGTGELKKNFSVHAHAFSASAKAAIEKAGGKATLIVKAAPAPAAAQEKDAKDAKAPKEAKAKAKPAAKAKTPKK